MFKGTSQCLTLNQFPLVNILQNLPMQNSYSDHRNFDSASQPRTIKACLADYDTERSMLCALF